LFRTKNAATRNAKYWVFSVVGFVVLLAKNTFFTASEPSLVFSFFEVRGAKCELIFDTGQNKSQILGHRMMDMNTKSVLDNGKMR